MIRFVVWDNCEEGFYESRSEHSVYFTQLLDNAKQFYTEEEAREETATCESPVILIWK